MIDDFDLHGREEAFDPFSVVLFKALQVIAFLFFVVFIIISPKANEGKVDSKAEFIITMDWPDNHPDDMDIFVQDPLGNIAWYRRRETGFLVLDRDDRGGLNDFVMVNGRKQQTKVREELVSIRGFVAGEYTVNVYHFTALTKQPVPVTVTVQKLNPVAKIVARETIETADGGSEQTAIRFTMDAQGEVTGTSREAKSILRGMHNAWSKNL